MATIKQGVFGGFSGKIGNVVGTSWKGIAVMKSLPLSVANPKTTGQVAQRGKFSMIVVLASLILSGLVKSLWDRFASKMSGYNDFVRTNIDCFDANTLVAPANLLLSSGKMGTTPIVSVSCVKNSQSASINWADDSASAFRLDDDVPFILITNASCSKVGQSGSVGQRADETVDVSCPFTFLVGEEYHAYLSFMRADGTIVNTSSYKAFVIQA